MEQRHQSPVTAPARAYRATRGRENTERSSAAAAWQVWADLTHERSMPWRVAAFGALAVAAAAGGQLTDGGAQAHATERPTVTATAPTSSGDSGPATVSATPGNSSTSAPSPQIGATLETRTGPDTNRPVVVHDVLSVDKPGNDGTAANSGPGAKPPQLPSIDRLSTTGTSTNTPGPVIPVTDTPISTAAPSTDAADLQPAHGPHIVAAAPGTMPAGPGAGTVIPDETGPRTVIEPLTVRANDEPTLEALSEKLFADADLAPTVSFSDGTIQTDNPENMYGPQARASHRYTNPSGFDLQSSLRLSGPGIHPIDPSNPGSGNSNENPYVANPYLELPEENGRWSQLEATTSARFGPADGSNLALTAQGQVFTPGPGGDPGAGSTSGTLSARGTIPLGETLGVDIGASHQQRTPTNPGHGSSSSTTTVDANLRAAHDDGTSFSAGPFARWNGRTTDGLGEGPDWTENQAVTGFRVSASTPVNEALRLGLNGEVYRGTSGWSAAVPGEGSVSFDPEALTGFSVGVDANWRNFGLNASYNQENIGGSEPRRFLFLGGNLEF